MLFTKTKKSPADSFPQSGNYFHQTAEGNELIAPFFHAALAKCWCMQLYIGIVLLAAIGVVLNGVCGAIFLLGFQQAHHLAAAKTACGHYFGYVYLLHPLQPVLVYGPGYFGGDVINEHRNTNVLMREDFLHLPNTEIFEPPRR